MPRIPFYRSRKFWADTMERSVSTFAQTAVALLTASGTGILAVSWVQVFDVSAMAFVVSVLKSMSAGNVGPKGTAGFVKTEEQGQ